MSVTVVKHPTLRGHLREVPTAVLDRWLAAGWLPLLDPEQAERLDSIADQIEAVRCPTCGAVGDDPCVTKGGNEAATPHADRPDSPAAATAADQGQRPDGEEN